MDSSGLAVATAASPLAPTVLLAPNLTIPAVALVTGEYTGGACVAAATSAIGLGNRNHRHEYGNQAQVGQAVRAALANASLGLKRSDLFVITKVEGGLTAAETAKRLAADVSLLGLEGPLDLVLLHFPKAAPFKSMEETVPCGHIYVWYRQYYVWNWNMGRFY